MLLCPVNIVHAIRSCRFSLFPKPKNIYIFTHLRLYKQLIKIKSWNENRNIITDLQVNDFTVKNLQHGKGL